MLQTHPTPCTPPQHGLQQQQLKTQEHCYDNVVTVSCRSVGVLVTGHESVDSLQIVGAKMFQLHDHLFTSDLWIVDRQLSTFIQQVFGNVDGRRFSRITCKRRVGQVLALDQEAHIDWLKILQKLNES